MIPLSILDELRKFDTPTICNILELFDAMPRTAGYMDARIQACYPKLPPMVGFATTATFQAPGTYVLRLTASDGVLSAFDDVAVQVRTQVLANASPSVIAGVDQVITLPAAAALAGTATDDGLPASPGKLTLGWTKATGPGAVTFADSKSAQTAASFDTPGSQARKAWEDGRRARISANRASA